MVKGSDLIRDIRCGCLLRDLKGETDGHQSIFIKKIHSDDDETEIEVTVSEEAHESGTTILFTDQKEGEQPLIIKDDKEITDKEMKDMDADNIETIEVFKGSMAIEKYGDKAKNGVVIIKTKKK